MKITFLGVGSAFSKKNGRSNILIENGTVKVLVDCGCTCSSALTKYGLSLKEITHIFITHLHADHVGGLEEMAFMTRLIYHHKPKLLASESLLERLWNCSLCGGLGHIELSPGDSTSQELNNFFTAQPLTYQEWITLDDDQELRFSLHPTNHVEGMESYGLEFEESSGGCKKRFFLSGDTKFEPEVIVHKGESCSLVFHDCQLFDYGENNRLGVHSSYQQLRRLPDDVRHKIWLYHYGDTRPLPDAERDGFAGFVKDLQSFTL